MARSGDISCQGIRYTYFNKGLDMNDIPATPQQGMYGRATWRRCDLWLSFEKATVIMYHMDDK